MPDIQELTAEEQALLDADRADQTPVEPTGPPPERTSPPTTRTSEQTEIKPGAETPPEKEEVPATEGEHPPQTVPYSALAEERNRRKEAEKRERANAEQMQRLSGRMEELNRLMAPRQEQPAKPTAQEQPIEVLSDLATRFDAMEKQRQEEAQWGQFGQMVTNAEREFIAKVPDGADAVKHLEAARIEELRAIGLSEPEITRTIQTEAVQIAALAFQQGVNPFERYYKLAQVRGYQSAQIAQEPAQIAQNSAQRAPNGQFQAAEKLAAVARGQQAAGRSLSGAGGGSNPGELTAEAIGAMSDEDFAALSDRVWKKVMDG